MSTAATISGAVDTSDVGTILETVDNGNDVVNSVVCTAEFTKLLDWFIKSDTGSKLAESACRASKPET